MSSRHSFAPDLLKACDIRGIVGQDLNLDDAYYVGRAYGTSLIEEGRRNCVVGFDGRLTSPVLCRRAVAGLVESGLVVTELGLAPTPLVYFAASHLDSDAGLVVTASHNPPEYNGFKFFTRSGPFHGARIRELARLCDSGRLAEGRGSTRSVDLHRDYLSYLLSFLGPVPAWKLRIVWDPGNGAVASILGDFVHEIPGSHRIICGEVDGRFPHHHPDPNIAANMRMLSDEVIAGGADLGIAFDGDGDRIGVVDGEGEPLRGDQLLTLFARDLLERHPGAAVMSEVKASRLFYDEVEARGGRAVMWKVGHTNQKERMAQEGISLAGETSGHIFFAENHGYDDALFAAVKLINILVSSGSSIAEVRAAFPRFYDSGEVRIKLDSDDRLRLLSETRQRLVASGRSFVGIDGLRTECEDGFWLMRGSNTEPHLTIRCEARSEAGLRGCIAEVRGHLIGSGFQPPFPEGPESPSPR